MDFESSLESVDLTNYIDNSEWELLSIEFEKGVHTYACCPDPHPGKIFQSYIEIDINPEMFPEGRSLLLTCAHLLIVSLSHVYK